MIDQQAMTIQKDGKYVSGILRVKVLSRTL